MSWICDTEGRLINLEDVRKIEVDAIVEPEGDTSHGVFAYGIQDADDDQPSYNLFNGSEEECEAWMLKLQAKMPLVRL